MPLQRRIPGQRLPIRRPPRLEPALRPKCLGVRIHFWVTRERHLDYVRDGPLGDHASVVLVVCLDEARHPERDCGSPAQGFFQHGAQDGEMSDVRFGGHEARAEHGVELGADARLPVGVADHAEEEGVEKAADGEDGYGCEHTQRIREFGVVRCEAEGAGVGGSRGLEGRRGFTVDGGAVLLAVEVEASVARRLRGSCVISGSEVCEETLPEDGFAFATFADLALGRVEPFGEMGEEGHQVRFGAGRGDLRDELIRIANVGGGGGGRAVVEAGREAAGEGVNERVVAFGLVEQLLEEEDHFFFDDAVVVRVVAGDERGGVEVTVPVPCFA